MIASNAFIQLDNLAVIRKQNPPSCFGLICFAVLCQGSCALRGGQRCCKVVEGKGLVGEQ